MTTTGFYRYSDIMWEWPKYDGGKHEQALKSIFNPDGLTDAGSPLRFAGAEGIELYIGEFSDRHKVLLFTSQQVEYARYFLSITGVLKPTETIRLPSWEYLHPVDNFVSPPTPYLFSAPAEIKDVVRQLDKHKRNIRQGCAGPVIEVRQSSGGKATTSSRARQKSSLKKQTASSNAQAALAKSRAAYGLMEDEGKGAFLAIDFETHEVQQQYVLEWAWSGVRYAPAQDQGFEETQGCGHYLARDYLLTLSNGKFVPDNRKKYLFGESQAPELADFQGALKDLIEEWRTYADASGGPLYMVFHDTSGDLKSLEKLGLKIPIHVDLPVTTQLAKTGEAYLLDTKILYEAVVTNGGSNERSRSLTTMCSHLGLQPKATFFHNAGNDAHYTLDCLKLMMVADPKLMWTTMASPDSSDEELP